MAECLKAFASRVAGAASLEAAAEPSAALAAQCLTALDRFETAFGNARLNFIYQTPGPAPSAAQMSSLTAGYAALFAATHTIVSLHALLGLASSPAAAPLSPPPPPPPPLSALRRAVQAALRPPRSLTGARMAAALGGAAALGVLSGSSKGFWAPVTAAFVMGGATVRVAAMRLQGTVVGAVASYAALLGCAAAWPQGGGARKAALLAGLSLWVGACTFMREASRVNGYAGFVAAFSASILLFGPDCGGLGGGGPEAECDAGAWEELQTWAMDRILMTLAGIAVVIAVTTASSDAPADAQRALEQLVGGVNVRRAWVRVTVTVTVTVGDSPAERSAPCLHTPPPGPGRTASLPALLDWLRLTRPPPARRSSTDRSTPNGCSAAQSPAHRRLAHSEPPRTPSPRLPRPWLWTLRQTPRLPMPRHLPPPRRRARQGHPTPRPLHRPRRQRPRRLQRHHSSKSRRSQTQVAGVRRTWPTAAAAHSRWI